jgi:hypothetical protein
MFPVDNPARYASPKPTSFFFLFLLPESLRFELQRSTNLHDGRIMKAHCCNSRQLSAGSSGRVGKLKHCGSVQPRCIDIEIMNPEGRDLSSW